MWINLDSFFFKEYSLEFCRFGLINRIRFFCKRATICESPYLQFFLFIFIFYNFLFIPVKGNICRNNMLSSQLLSLLLRFYGFFLQFIKQVKYKQNIFKWQSSNYNMNQFRLSPYLNGNHHVEDIMYRMNLDRSTVVRILDTFSCVLICYSRPEFPRD